MRRLIKAALCHALIACAAPVLFAEPEESVESDDWIVSSIERVKTLGDTRIVVDGETDLVAELRRCCHEAGMKLDLPKGYKVMTSSEERVELSHWEAVGQIAFETQFTPQILVDEIRFQDMDDSVGAHVIHGDVLMCYEAPLYFETEDGVDIPALFFRLNYSQLDTDYARFLSITLRSSDDEVKEIEDAQFTGGSGCQSILAFAPRETDFDSIESVDVEIETVKLTDVVRVRLLCWPGGKTEGLGITVETLSRTEDQIYFRIRWPEEGADEHGPRYRDVAVAAKHFEDREGAPLRRSYGGGIYYEHNPDDGYIYRLSGKQVRREAEWIVLTFGLSEKIVSTIRLDDWRTLEDNYWEEDPGE